MSTRPSAYFAFQAIRRSPNKATYDTLSLRPRFSESPGPRAMFEARNSFHSRSCCADLATSRRALSYSSPSRATSNPNEILRKTTSANDHVIEPASITIKEFHTLSDIYIDELVSELEEMQEQREEVDCEYSVRRTSFILLSYFLFILFVFAVGSTIVAYLLVPILESHLIYDNN